MHATSLVSLVLALGAGAAAAQSTIPNADPAGVPSSAARTAPALQPQGPNGLGASVTRTQERAGVSFKAGVSKILVYDHNSIHGQARLAAQGLSPAGTTVAGSADFDTLLTSQTWDVVALDCPSTIPSGGWTSLINYVNAGGAAILSFWDWDNDSGLGGAALTGAFDVSVSSTISFTGATLTDAKVSPAFLGVTMPNSDWHGHWGDDGDRFTPLAGAQGLAHVGTPATPVMVRGNAGKTIAAPVFDEAGDDWLADGSGIRLWENLIQMVGHTDGPDVLVYDHDTIHHLAQIAAFESYPGTTQRATATDFNARLASQPWDVVLVDCPNVVPGGGWGPLMNHVSGNGHVVLSFWDWDASSAGSGDPALPGAFDVSVVSSFSWNGLTLFDSGTTNVFAGVSMPNSSWNDNFFDDGDRFTPVAPAKGMAHVGSASQPVLVWGNAARTIAAPVFDEAGPVWLGNGSGVQLWKNMMSKVFEPEPDCNFRNGILGLNPSDYTCITPPVLGGLWVASVDTTPLLGTQTLATFVTLGLGGPAQGIPVFGFELLILPPFFETNGLGIHNIPVSEEPTLAGLTIASQGARLEIAGGSFFVVLTNGQDVTFGL